VNHYHNDGIYLSELAVGANVVAMDRENGTVEAFQIRDKKLLALQWHPERPFKTEAAKIQSARIVEKFLQSI
jgi:gamma-glutamyl-gamma-aminobutyrate hydrolase PuuD